jgi:hypothetical protein
MKFQPLKGYKDKEKRRKYVQRWAKDNYNKIVGFRPICTFDVLCGDLKNQISVSPKDFLFGKDKTEPLTLYGTAIVVHVPRSLLSRAKIYVNKVTGEIKGTSAMQSAN